MPGGIALRLDDVGAASKRFEVYGRTRLPVGGWQLPFPGNFLFLKYLPPIKRWGPYRELTAREWEQILGLLEGSGARMTVAITAGWVESDGRVVPYPRKFPDAAAMVSQAVHRGLVEPANHGLTHCVLQDRLFRPRAFRGNRAWHREFVDWIPASVHREHLVRAQATLEDYFGIRVVTFVPPGNAFTRETVEAARDVGLCYLSSRDAARWGPAEGMVFVDDARVRVLHDRDLVLGGPTVLAAVLRDRSASFRTVRALAAESAS
jgi:peptidoglycan/xylan/chitin deacetylase (PgdA/CDA1 family)